MNKNVQKKIEEWEYPNNTQGKRIPKKGNTINQLKVGDARKQLKEGGRLEHSQGIMHALKQIHRMAS